jgi:ElaB/YqjD/DUF883 family membrane-anchored ribosome-binding protein
MTQQDKTSGQPAPRKQELHAQIDETKSAIAGELRELGDKLSPEHLKEGMKDMLHEAKSEAKEAIYEAKNAVVDTLRTAKDHAVDSVTETMSEVGERARRAGSVTADFVSTNAVPLSLIGLGAGWLMLTMRRQRTMREQGGYYQRDYESRRFGESGERSMSGRYGQRSMGPGYGERSMSAGYGERSMSEFDDDYSTRGGEFSSRGGEFASEARDKASQLVQRGKEKVENLVEATKERSEHMRDRVGEKFSDLGERGREYSHEARMRLERASRSTVEFAHENPLAVSALAVAAGVGFGLLLPSSRAEDRLLGPARGRLMGEARELMGEAKDTAQHAMQAARETASEVKQTLTSGPSH